MTKTSNSLLFSVVIVPTCMHDSNVKWVKNRTIREWLGALYRQQFYRAMLRRVRYCYGKSSFRLSDVRPSITLVDCDHIVWNSSKIISRLVSLGCSLSETPTLRIYFNGNTLELWLEREGYGKKWPSAYKSSNISETQQDTIKDQYEIPYALSGCCKNQRPWMTLEGHYALCLQTDRQTDRRLAVAIPLSA